MKFYESHYDDYYRSVDENNYHTELIEEFGNFPDKLIDFNNTIIYGPTGVGKYSQMLYFLKKYSPSLLKYEKKITAIIDKQSYTYKISDIHYEVDMSLLGCYSRILWHEIFQQVVDIVSVKVEKQGIIVCKNFHGIHNELLDIFYSYIQQHSSKSNPVKIKFILITEHLSFIPDNIMNCCRTISVKRPNINEILQNKQIGPDIMNEIGHENLINLKEIFSFPMLKNSEELPIDNFNTICDGIILDMNYHHNMIRTNCKQTIDICKFRDQMYDILIYNLDAIDCVWYIFTHFVRINYFSDDKVREVMESIYVFLKQYGNNYRAIFHIESIIFKMICCFSP